jgi:gamma-glutamylcyclotransferase (GGCT)/AIG2-like uncharacterized protein YtfP
MGHQQMLRRAARATFLGRGLLRGASLLINFHGYATVIPSPSDCVEGVLWEITGDDEESLDDYEAVAEGLYSKRYTTIELETGLSTAALIYIATDATPGRANPAYLEEIIASAKAQGFSTHYVKRLELFRNATTLPPKSR